MKTVMAKFTDKTCLRIQGIKGKFDEQGNLIDHETQKQIEKLIDALTKLISEA